MSTESAKPLGLGLGEGLGPLLTEQAIRDIANGLNGVQPMLGQWQRDLRLARAVEAAARKHCAAAVRATPTHRWVDGSDQWGSPCPAKVLTTREEYARACERA